MCLIWKQQSELVIVKEKTSMDLKKECPLLGAGLFWLVEEKRVEKN